MSKRVIVFMGGWSVEREVSLSSGAAVTEALIEAGYAATAVDVSRDMAALLAVLDPAPDIVFTALHGRYGEDGRIQGLLDMLAIPYTHSGLLASALAMNKPMAKKVMEAAGIACTPGQVVAASALWQGDVIERPYVVKPIDEGSSVLVHIVTEDDPERLFSEADWPYAEVVLVVTLTEPITCTATKPLPPALTAMVSMSSWLVAVTATPLMDRVSAVAVRC